MKNRWMMSWGILISFYALEMDAALPHVTSGRAVEYIYWFAVFFNSIFLVDHLDVSLAGTIFA